MPPANGLLGAYLICALRFSPITSKNCPHELNTRVNNGSNREPGQQLQTPVKFLTAAQVLDSLETLQVLPKRREHHGTPHLLET